MQFVQAMGKHKVTMKTYVNNAFCLVPNRYARFAAGLFATLRGLGRLLLTIAMLSVNVFPYYCFFAFFGIFLHGSLPCNG